MEVNSSSNPYGLPDSSLLDLHAGNVAFTLPSIQALQEPEFLQQLVEVEMGPVWRIDGAPLESGMPRYLARPAEYSLDLDASTNLIKIIDLGQSFSRHDIFDEFHNPIALRPPEVVFRDNVDHRIDMWSMGCLVSSHIKPILQELTYNQLFELLTKQPLFDTIMATPKSLIDQMLETITDELPERWQEQFRAMGKDHLNEEPHSLQEWLEKCYFDKDRNTELSREDIIKVGALIQKMLRFEPSARASAREILQDPWFNED